MASINGKMAFLFLTISEKTLDTKSNHSLTSDKNFGAIVAKLSTRNVADLELLTQLSCAKTLGVLIEFPGVILATFVPILETLQNKQRLGVCHFGNRFYRIPPLQQSMYPRRCMPANPGSYFLYRVYRPPEAPVFRSLRKNQ